MSPQQAASKNSQPELGPHTDNSNSRIPTAFAADMSNPSFFVTKPGSNPKLNHAASNETSLTEMHSAMASHKIIRETDCGNQSSKLLPNNSNMQ